MASAALKTALLLGGTGATGKQVFEELKASQAVGKIIFVTRRDMKPAEENSKVVYLKVDFDKLEDHKEAFQGADVGFCCLGTTRAKSGKEGFIKVDYDYVLESAKILKESGKCKDFHLVSSQGADASSWFLYMGTKGKIEEAVKSLGFDRVSVYRPGLLITPREETRLLEKCAQTLVPFLDRGSSKSISVENLAKAMVKNAFINPVTGNETLENSDIVNIIKT